MKILLVSSALVILACPPLRAAPSTSFSLSAAVRHPLRDFGYSIHTS